MVGRARVAKGAVALMAAAVILMPRLSYADRDDRHHEDGREHRFFRYHDHPRFGLHFSILPDGYFSVWAGSGRYYYYDGLYYSRVGPDYVLVAPPIGAVVTTIPSEFQPAYINGVTYYVDNGTYYVYTPRGYQVVPQPVAPVGSAPAPAAVPARVAAPPAAAEPEESFTINIPNDKGGSTPVMMRRSGGGFYGPQGEYYSEFPSVKQLKAMYGK